DRISKRLRICFRRSRRLEKRFPKRPLPNGQIQALMSRNSSVRLKAQPPAPKAVSKDRPYPSESVFAAAAKQNCFAEGLRLKVEDLQSKIGGLQAEPLL